MSMGSRPPPWRGRFFERGPPAAGDHRRPRGPLVAPAPPARGAPPIGPGARHELARVMPRSAKRAAVVTQDAVAGAGWLDGLDPGLPFEVCTIGDGETTKTLATVEELGRQF